MGARHALRFAGLADAAADFIQTHPQAAEFAARKISGWLRSCGNQELEEEREREERARVTGRPAY